MLGVSDHCIATHPSDMCVAMVVLDAVVHTVRPDGTTRAIPFRDFHLAPGDTPHIEVVLTHGELITHIVISHLPAARRSRYLKVRDRASYEFALASAAVVLDLDGDTIRAARLGLGGIATKPWRAIEAEQFEYYKDNALRARLLVTNHSVGPYVRDFHLQAVLSRP